MCACLIVVDLDTSAEKDGHTHSCSNLSLLHSGLIPRLLGDVFSLWICNMLAHFINTYAIDDSVRTCFLVHCSAHPVVVLGAGLCLNNLSSELRMKLVFVLYR